MPDDDAVEQCGGNEIARRDPKRREPVSGAHGTDERHDAAADGNRTERKTQPDHGRPVGEKDDGRKVCGDAPAVFPCGRDGEQGEAKREGVGRLFVADHGDESPRRIGIRGCEAAPHGKRVVNGGGEKAVRNGSQCGDQAGFK